METYSIFFFLSKRYSTEQKYVYGYKEKIAKEI